MEIGTEIDLFFYSPERVDFLDIMIYLNDVGENDGPFAFLSKDPTNSQKEVTLLQRLLEKLELLLYQELTGIIEQHQVQAILIEI